MAEKENKPKKKYALDYSKEGSYRGTGRSLSGYKIYKNETVNDLMWLKRSAKAGFDSEIQIRPKQAKKFADLVKQAEASGGKVTVVPKGQKREFIARATGNALFRGGPRIGSAAAEAFLSAGGRVAGKGIKAQGYLPKGVSAKQFGILKLGMKTDNPAFTRKKKKKFGEE